MFSFSLVREGSQRTELSLDTETVLPCDDLSAVQVGELGIISVKLNERHRRTEEVVS